MNNDRGESLEYVPTNIRKLEDQVDELKITVTKLERWITNYEYQSMMANTRHQEQSHKSFKQTIIEAKAQNV